MPDAVSSRLPANARVSGLPTVMLVDNGSRRADSTLNLRRLAAELSERSGVLVHPVSLQHSDRVPADRLDGVPAEVFAAFVGRTIEQGQRRFVVLPLFFGPSRALTEFIPEQVARLESLHGRIDMRQADVLCPLPAGEPKLVDILLDNVQQANRSADRIIVVDHGSPIPQVTAVRHWLAEAMRKRIDPSVAVEEAVMERREGRDYDFNGQLLAQRLDCASGDVVVAMLFLSPGRHAGEGGDIAEICADAEASNPGLKVTASALVGEHPLLVDILLQRLESAVDLPAVTA